MKAIWRYGWLIASVLAVTVAAADLWETDFAKAQETARKTNRYLLLDFSGSDWCGWCIRLDREVFSQDAFKKYAAENLVCVLLDFPRSKQLDQQLREQNEKLRKKFHVTGFPTVIILSPTGDKVAETGYQPGGAEKYVEHLGGFIDPHRKKHNIPAPTPTAAPPNPEKKSAE